MKSTNAGSIRHRPFRYPSRQSALHCEDASLEKLAEEFGTPVYVYSERHILERYRQFSRAFANRRHLVCYSVKANSNLSILKLLADKGSGFDIVSGGELERVLHVSKKAAKRVVFSGVGKTAPEMDLALRAGILLFNVESESEIALLSERAKKLRLKTKIALRVNPDVFAETHPYISTGLREHKFGVDVDAAHKIYWELKNSKYLDAAGISVHIGSQIRSADPFGAAIGRVAELARSLKKDGINIRYIDAGGGLGVDYHLPGGKDPEEEVRGYAAALDQALRGLDVQLLLEPGRFIVAQAGALVSRVLYIKRNGKKTFVITDAAMNDLLRPALYQAYHSICSVSPARAGVETVVDIVGPICESGDFFARDRKMPKLKEGDLLAILDAGAYGMSFGSNYNTRPLPAEVMVKGKKARVIRRRQKIKDLLVGETKG